MKDCKIETPKISAGLKDLTKLCNKYYFVYVEVFESPA